MCCVYDTTCEDVASHVYNLERLHVVGIHNMCEQTLTSLAVGVVLALIIFPPMTTIVWELAEFVVSMGEMCLYPGQ